MARFIETLAGAALAIAITSLFLVTRSWRVEGSLKAATHELTISLAAGLSFAGFSVSAAAVLNGPGVLAIHLRTRQLWKRSVQRVSIEGALRWLDDRIASKPLTKKRGRATSWLIKRTDTGALPSFGIRVLTGLHNVSLRGAIKCGFVDPALTGKIASWLFPLAGVLAPLGELNMSFDWTGTTIVDVDVEWSCRLIPARILFEGLRFARHHVHLTRPLLPRESIA